MICAICSSRRLFICCSQTLENKQHQVYQIWIETIGVVWQLEGEVCKNDVRDPIVDSHRAARCWMCHSCKCFWKCLTGSCLEQKLQSRTQRKLSSWLINWGGQDADSPVLMLWQLYIERGLAGRKVMSDYSFPLIPVMLTLYTLYYQNNRNAHYRTINI